MLRIWNLMKVNIFTNNFQNFVTNTVDTALKNFWYHPMQELILSEKADFQLARTKVLFKSKIVSFQLVEYSRTANYNRSVYLQSLFTYHYSSREHM